MYEGVSLLMVFCCVLCSLEYSEGNPVARQRRNAFLGGGGLRPSSDQCQLSDIPTQSAFDTSRFAGKWYLISDYNVEGQVVSNVFDIDDVQAVFQPRSFGNMKIATAARVTARVPYVQIDLGSVCFQGHGVAERSDVSDAAKFTITYKTYVVGLLTNTARPYWVLSTDYENYALIYSCFSELEDGTCAEDSTFAWTLSRHRTGHTHHHRRAIGEVATTSCLDPQYFRLRDTDTMCEEL